MTTSNGSVNNSNCFECFKICMITMIIICITFSISITSIVLGVININSIREANDCSGYSQIPVYLIITGVIGLIVNILNMLKKKDKENKDTCVMCHSKLLNLFYFVQVCVLIWGAVILFNKPRPSCATVMFDFAFAITLAAYVIFAIMCVVCVCVIIKIIACPNETPSQEPKLSNRDSDDEIAIKIIDQIIINMEHNQQTNNSSEIKEIPPTTTEC